MAKQPTRRKPARPTPKPPPTVRVSARPPATPSEVRLVARTRPRKDRGGGPGGFAWEIYVGDEIAGEVFINRVDEGAHKGEAFIEIYLNRENQGRKIGRTAYRLAAEQSSYDTVHAVMRKSNNASWRAAEEAGFVDATPPGGKQKAMLWRRKK
ncbi:MAG: GNAT family N-acetyltransferase [Parvularculaceae bacterium]